MVQQSVVVDPFVEVVLVVPPGVDIVICDLGGDCVYSVVSSDVVEPIVKMP